MRLLSLVITAAIFSAAFAQEKPNESKAAEENPNQDPMPSQEELEAKFKATLTKATLSGRWASVKEGALGPAKEDKYTILGVSKVGGDMWLIHTRIQYNQKDIVAPIPVQVKWAGDTPVITLDKVPVPGGGVYSARVLVYGDTYAGTWSGGSHGGLLHGVITREGGGKSAESE